MPPDDPARIRHEGCRTCGEDLARYPERPCDRCGWRYHAECLMGTGCTNPACQDPLLVEESLPAVRAGPALPVDAARKASCPRRFAAFLMDVGVAATGIFAGMFLSGALGLGLAGAQGLTMAIALAVVFTNDVVLNGVRGASVGKKAVGIKITTADGEVPGLARAFIREWPGKMLSYWFYWLGFLVATVDPETRTLHDRMAGTWVIEAESRVA